jgi:hypothetical protein
MKKVTFGGKPTARSSPTSPDDWVHATEGGGEETKRLTVDISCSLHQRVKSQCALQGLNMADAVRELLEKRFPPDEQQGASANQIRASQSDQAVTGCDPPVK